MEIQKKVLSGSENGKIITLKRDPSLIHVTPHNLEHSEIWLYAVNTTDKPQILKLKINGTEYKIEISSNKGVNDLYGGAGAITNSGDKFEAYCDEPDALFITGYVYQFEKKENKDG